VTDAPSAPAPHPDPLRLVSYNIRFGGRGRDGLIADVLGKLEPDVVILEEATDPAVVESIAGKVGMVEVLARPDHSVAAMSRVPIDGADWHLYRRGRAVLELGVPGRGLRVMGVHLTAGMSWRGERVRIVEAGSLLEGIQGAAPPGLGAATPGPALAGVPPDRADPERVPAKDVAPVTDHPVETGGTVPPATTKTGEAVQPPHERIVVGDFNSVAPGDAPVIRRMPWWVRLLLRFDGGIHTRVIQMFLDAGFIDAYRRLNPEALGFTLPAVNPSVRLDYAMLSPDLVPRLRSCSPIAPDGLTSPLLRASDHLPLLTVLD
jgi:endonuclease/exonuclease/phosphatase family metal-dependent hydrolase